MKKEMWVKGLLTSVLALGFAGTTLADDVDSPAVNKLEYKAEKAGDKLEYKADKAASNIESGAEAMGNNIKYNAKAAAEEIENESTELANTAEEKAKAASEEISEESTEIANATERNLDEAGNEIAEEATEIENAAEAKTAAAAKSVASETESMADKVERKTDEYERRVDPMDADEKIYAATKKDTIIVDLADTNLANVIKQRIATNSLNEKGESVETTAYVAVWPTSKFAAKSDEAEDFVEEKASAIEKELANALPDASVKTYNMADDLNWFQKTLNTDTAIVKRNAKGKAEKAYEDYDEKKMAELGEIFKKEGSEGKAVIVLETVNKLAH